MILEDQYGIVYNLKANSYRRMMKATREHTVVSNLLNRNFKRSISGKVLLTDRTYLFYGNGEKSYLFTITNVSTNEILAYNVSSNLALNLATATIQRLVKSRKVKLAIDAFIHFNQGVHYTNPEFQALAKKVKLRPINVTTRKLLE